MRKGVRAERSAIPAKGDRGLSGSAMVRSYSQVPRTTRGRIGRHLPLRPGPAGDVQRRLVPRRGWECWTLEMAEHLIFKRLLEVISNRSAGNGRSPGPPPFPDFQGHFRAHEGEPGRLDVADATDAVEVEEFSTEYEALGRARELLEDGDHGGV